MNTEAHHQTPAPLPMMLLGDIKTLMEEGRRQAATAVNMGLTLLYWRVGQRIHAEILQNELAAYGVQIVSALSRQLSWSHFLEVIYQKDPLKRDFYAEMCRIKRWSVRDLRERMTVLPAPEVLHRKLHEAIETARARIEANSNQHSSHPHA